MTGLEDLGSSLRDTKPVAETPGVSGHTPGPWEVYADHFYSSCLAEVGHLVISARHDVHDWENPATHEANARLIAAAPDLLEALKGLMRCEDDASSSAAGGLKDCIDNTGRYYQSADLAERIAEASAAVAKATTASSVGMSEANAPSLPTGDA